MAVLLAGLIFLLPERGASLDVRLTMPRTNYFLGELVDFFISTTNGGLLRFPSSIQSAYSLDGLYSGPNFANPVITFATIPRTWTNTHTADGWNQYALAPGPHRVCGIVDASLATPGDAYGKSATNTFWILPPPPVKGNFLIDFTHLIGTNVTTVSLAPYEFSGVHFTNISSGSLFLGDALQARGIRAQFNMPVFAVSAKIAGLNGAQITMIAKNAAGQILATSVSEPIVRALYFDQKLAVDSLEPIASVEWTSIPTNQSVSIDDVFITTGPVLKHSVQNDGVRIIWPTVTNKLYQVWSSSDLRTWLPEGAPQSSVAGALTNFFPTQNSGSKFFRVSEEN